MTAADVAGDARVFSEYNPEGLVHVTADDSILNIPYMTRRASEILFANAYIRTVADIANLPTRYPGLASAFAQDEDFKTWSLILQFAEKVVNTPGGVTIDRSLLSASQPTADSTGPQPGASPEGAYTCHIM